MQAERALEKIAEEISKCKKCRLWRSRTKAVPGEGPVDAKILFVGEAPGAMEDLLGKPFVGPSGKFLDKMLKISKLKRRNIFITSPLKCRPPGNRKPKPDEIKRCLPYLLKQIEVVNPKIIVLLGDVAIKCLLKEKIEVSKKHGEILEREGRKYFITFHPAAGRRFPNVGRAMHEDFVLLRKAIQAT